MAQPQGPFPGQMQPSPEQMKQIQAQIAAEAEKAGMTVPQFIQHSRAQHAARMAQQGQQQPSPEQIRAMQAQLTAEAEKAGLTVPQFIERQRQAQAQAQAAGMQPGQQPSPEQIRAMQAQVTAEAEKAGLTVPQFIERQRQAQAQAQAAGMQQGQQPSPEQIRAMQAQIAAEAEKAGMTVPEYVERIKAQAMQQQQMRQQQQQGAQPGKQVPIAPGPPKPEGIAVAKFLRSQDLKLRTCIFNDQRKDMFKVKRAIRALHSPAYEKARKKNPLLPEVKDRVTAENTLKLLPLSMLALRVSKVDPHDGHNHGKKKRTKGLWTVKVEPQQEARDDYHYVFLYEGAQWKNKLYAAGALGLILAVVFFPLWPYSLRLGVWYLSMGMLGLLGLFFAMAIFRLILFLITMFVAAPGFWLYPNLFEDVGFFDSFKPLWAWHEDELTIKKRKKEERQRKKAKREAKANGTHVDKKEATPQKAVQAASPARPASSSASSSDGPDNSRPNTSSATGVETAPNNTQQRSMGARVEEVEDE
jgi:translocation protein SEC62